MMKKIYDLTELKHTFVSSKTKLFAALTIIIFMIVGCLHAQAKNDNLVASIDNLDKLIGCSKDDVKSKAISDNTFPTDDKSAIFFLYNVKTGLLLNAGGYWGTHVSLKEFGSLCGFIRRIRMSTFTSPRSLTSQEQPLEKATT